MMYDKYTLKSRRKRVAKGVRMLKAEEKLNAMRDRMIAKGKPLPPAMRKRSMY